MALLRNLALVLKLAVIGLLVAVVGIIAAVLAGLNEAARLLWGVICFIGSCAIDEWRERPR